MNVFELAYKALMSCDIDKKIELTNNLYSFSKKGLFNIQQEYPIYKVENPGRPTKPSLVRFQKVPKRDSSDIGMIKTIHAICHIEFNAINLALDAVYRFRSMPYNFYQDWIRVAFEETKHFSLIRQYLIELGHNYGDFEAHNGLWVMTLETDYDVLSRMAIVPRVLEARGLDVTPSIQNKFRASKFNKMVDILDIIFRDEIGHVKIGNYWFHTLCRDRNIDPINIFDQLINKHIGTKLRGPFNLEAREMADFSKMELDYLQAN
jgi:uncharacterized ferritin-like protein (DUF455 family)